MRDSRRDTDVKNSLLDSVGEGEGGMTWEGSLEMCILSYVTGPVYWNDPGGWDGEGVGRGVQDGVYMSTNGWFMSMYGKNHYNIVK